MKWIGALFLHTSSFAVHHIQLAIQTVKWYPNDTIADTIWDARFVHGTVTAVLCCVCAAMILVNYGTPTSRFSSLPYVSGIDCIV
jgi:hypothetical protein